MASAPSQLTTSRPTIKDIAEACGVSKTAVSLAMNRPVDNCPLHPDTRARILKVVEEMGFRPQWTARSFSQKKTRTIALLYDMPLPPVSGIYEPIIQEFITTLRDEHYHCLFIPVTGPLKEWEDLLLEGRTDGFLVLDKISPDLKNVLTRARLPVVLLNGMTDMPVNQIRFDDYMGGKLATEHLVSRGHKNIAFYAGPAATSHYSLAQRTQAFKHVMQQANLKDNARIVVAGFEAFARELAQRKPDAPTALIVFSHFTALDLMRELPPFGLRIPEDLSLICFNDVYPVNHVNPPLTAISVPSSDIGRTAADMLLKQIKDPDGHQSAIKIFPEMLVERKSTLAIELPFR